MADALLVEQNGPVVLITLNRPDHGNAVDDAVLDALAARLETISTDPSVRVVTFRGAGNTFCRGRESKPAAGSPPPTPLARRRSLEKITRVNAALAALPAVTIAAVNGDALGFGSGLAVQCDLAVAVESAMLGFPEIDAALPPTIVMSYLGRYVPRKVATELVLTGRRVTARDAERLGLVNRVTESAEELTQAVQAFTEVLLGKDALALRTAKQFLHETRDMTVEEASRYGLNVLPIVLAEPRS